MKWLACASLSLLLTISGFTTPTWSQSGFRGVSTRPAGNSVAPVRSQNFIVRAPDARLAQKVSQQAEVFRKQLALEWLGRELPPWPQPCPIEVILDPHAGGETSFAFIDHDPQGRGRPVDWQMKIYGPPDRLLDAVLPHEVTHTIFATHFGRPLPRWADEGACTTVEHVSERKKNHQMLLNFLSAKPSRGIPFNHMFRLKQYPQDILPLYAQGYSLSKFLIYQQDRRHFVEFIGRGLQYESRMPALPAWTQAVQESYQYKDLSELQLSWQAWVRAGSDAGEIGKFAKQPKTPADVGAANATYTSLPTTETPYSSPQAMAPNSAPIQSASTSFWYGAQMQPVNTSQHSGNGRASARRDAAPNSGTTRWR